jgi:hypothetical protein
MNQLNPDVQQAAERLIVCEYDANGLLEKDGKRYSQALDGLHVARAYRALASLALIREDDQREIDEAWLRSVGDISESGICSVGRISIWRNGSFGWYVSIAFSNPIHYETLTRGDLRRLAAALKIPLREGAEDA